MFLEKNRSRIINEFDRFCDSLPEITQEIREKADRCSEELGLAVKYLYGNMPLSDVGNYDFEIFLDFASQGVNLWENSPYVKNMPEDIFLNYVLYHRVNEEEIKPCRKLFGGLLKERTEGLSMEEAVLEVNYWCAEEATYQTTDARTSSALEVYRCGYGRCGEESVLAVNAFRSAGIPARQVYAPRWSHCDDNHAWVEVWCDGSWHYLGACEPEAVLDKGWFNNAASRAMMISSRWFGESVPDEEPAGLEGMNLMLNQLGRYAETTKIRIKAENLDGCPAEGAEIHAEVYNYGEFYPVTKLIAGEDGWAEVRTGLGTLHIFACLNGKRGECFMDTRVEKQAVCVLGEEISRDVWKAFDIVAPADTAKEPPAGSREQEEKNAGRVREAMEYRRRKTESFRPVWPEKFLADDREKAQEYMSVLSEKDRRDACPEVLIEHYEESQIYKDTCPRDIFLRYIWNPRVSDEILTKWRKEIRARFTEEEAEDFRRNPVKIWSWIHSRVSSKTNKERNSIFTTPAAVMRLKTAGENSKKVLFVAIARTFGIPARLNPADHSMEYYKEGAFVPVCPEAVKDARVILRAAGHTWTYEGNWSIAKLGEKGFRTLDFTDAKWEGDTLVLPLEAGEYRILTGNRLPTGNVFGKRYDFTVEKGQTHTVSMELREAELADMLDSHTIPASVLFDMEGNERLLSDYTGEKSRILFWLDVSKEPTEHILNELAEMKAEFEKYQERLLFIVRSPEDLKDVTLCRCREFLPEIEVCCHDFGKDLEMTARRMYVNPDMLPLLVVTDGKLRGIFAASGYSVGMADMLLRVLKCTKC